MPQFKKIYMCICIYLMMMKLVKLKRNQEMVQTGGPTQVNHWSLSYHNILKTRILTKECFISIKSSHLLFQIIIIVQHI